MQNADVVEQTSVEAGSNTSKNKSKGRIKKYLFRGFLAIVVALAIAQVVYTYSGSGEWELVGEQNGIVVHSMKRPGENLKLFKGVFSVDSTLARIVTFMQDQDNELEVGFYEPKEIDRLDEQISWTEWRAEFPSPFKDREFVVKHEFTQNPENLEVFYQLRATPDKLPPNDCCVRLPRMDNSWRLIPLENGQIEIVWIIDMDVGGFVPYFVMNMSHPTLIFDFASDLQRFFDKDKYDDAGYDWLIDAGIDPNKKEEG